jgi:hypothetical protein
MQLRVLFFAAADERLLVESRERRALQADETQCARGQRALWDARVGRARHALFQGVGRAGGDTPRGARTPYFPAKGRVDRNPSFGQNKKN